MHACCPGTSTEWVVERTHYNIWLCIPVGVLEPILRKEYLIQGVSIIDHADRKDTEIFIQIRAFSGENNNPTPVCIVLGILVTISGKT